MADPLTISPEPPANKALDYAALKEEGTRLIQQLSGSIWTDYNEHDPGVTTLEQLCYALTELSYRAEFPLADLLIDKPGGRIEPHRQALFIPRRILPCNPITENDYRKLIIDRVPLAANVWLTPHLPEEGEGVNGLYDIWIYAPGADACSTDGLSPDSIREEVRRVYCHHRGLCEDIHELRILEPVTTIVSADASIDESRTPEAILAQLLFQLGDFLAPEPRRTSLKSLLDAGQTPEQIFDGPLLVNGFIPDDQLQPKATQIPVRELIRVMARSPGVASVRNVKVRVGDKGPVYGSDGSIPVPEGEILQLDTRPDTRRGFSIRLFRNGLEIQPNPARVRRELDKLWADARRTYELGPQYEEYLRLPEGRYHDFEEYYSIQNQYPNIYGINSFGLRAGASKVRQGQARQLKGYLLAFEQLLADFLAQLARVRDLYSIELGLQHTYFYQYLNRAVPDVEPLLKKGEGGEGNAISYEQGLPLLVQSQDPFIDRRNRFLDFLLALYGEALDADSLAPVGDEGSPGKEQGGRLIRAKLALLHHLVESTHDRSRGIDYLESPSKNNVAGMTIKSRIQLGMDVFHPRPLIDVLDELALEIVETEAKGAAAGRGLERHADFIEANFSPVPPPVEQGTGTGREGAQMLRVQTVAEDFLLAAGERENFRVGSLPGDETVAVVCKAGSGDGWHLVGKYPDREAAVARVHALAGVAHPLKQSCQQLYIVEHTLLRSAGKEKEEGFVYSFTATAVISPPGHLRRDVEYQRFAREVIRQNAPSHVVMESCFLGPGQMAHFERLYWAWRRALRHQEEPGIVETSARLRDFLLRCQRQEAA